MRYWYLLSLYIPIVWTLVTTWPHSRMAAVLGFMVVTALYAGIGWLNERAGVPFLMKERARVEAHGVVPLGQTLASALLTSRQ